MSNKVDINYIIKEPRELLSKLLREAEKIVDIPDKNDFFNFVVTAAVLSEWIPKHYKSVILDDLRLTLKNKSNTGLPKDSDSWIEDRACLPNKEISAEIHILNCIRICWETTKASKHYEWRTSSGISSISTEAKIEGFYDYFFTSTEKGLFIRYEGYNYSIVQVKNVLIQFYPKLISYLEALQDEE